MKVWHPTFGRLTRQSKAVPCHCDPKARDHRQKTQNNSRQDRFRRHYGNLSALKLHRLRRIEETVDRVATLNEVEDQGQAERLIQIGHHQIERMSENLPTLHHILLLVSIALFSGHFLPLP